VDVKRTDIYRRQHDRLLEAAASIASRLQDDPAAGAEPIRAELSTLAGLLKMHLTMEDEGLYPSLRDNEDQRVRDTARSFAEEMGGLAEAFTAYNTRWSAATIRDQPEAFVRETRGVFDALVRRILRENSELYPLLES
jgi:hypothetical protein